MDFIVMIMIGVTLFAGLLAGVAFIGGFVWLGWALMSMFLGLPDAVDKFSGNMTRKEIEDELEEKGYIEGHK